MNVTDILRYIRLCAVRRFFYPLFFLVIAIVILLCEPLLEFFSIHPISPDSAISPAVNLGYTFVRSSVQDLYYTGDDYYVDGVLTGHYYYQLTGDYCRLYIISPSQGKPADALLEGREVTGRIVKIGSAEETLLSDLADDLSWSVEGLSAVCDPYMINEAYYFPLTARLLFAAMLAALLIGLTGFFYHLLLVLRPRFSKMYRRLKKYGNAEAILKDAQHELDHRRLVNRGSLVLTPKYLFSFNAELTSLIPLEDVLWIFPMQNMKYSFRSRREKMFFSLRIVTVEGDVFVLKDKPKKDLDKIYGILIESYPNFFYGYSAEHDRMVHQILEENKKELKERRKYKKRS